MSEKHIGKVIQDSPVSTASVPRTRPSVLLMAMQRATLSPVS